MLAPLTLCLWIAAAPMDVPATQPSTPARPVTFGVVADVQYADRDTQGTRRFREAIGKLERAMGAFNRARPAFVLQLGDLFDTTPDDPKATRQNLADVAAALPRLKVPWRHVVGNHCLDAGRAAFDEAVPLDRWHYSFDVPANGGGWRFIVLDGNAVSTRDLPEDDPRHVKAREIMADDEDHKPWNGALGDAQHAWLAQQLEAADADGVPVIIACHFPATPQATGGDPTITLWDAEAVLERIARHDGVKAYFAGHHHGGGYAEVDGVHHVTFPAICDAPQDGNAYALVTLHADRIEIDGTGDVPDRVLAITP